ncbi:Lactaldehyde dehydrogenase [Vibrio nigripulchritudo MADA3029]|uniref:aldehyde dehydrogenase n=1 Tax=Vibrio nigripulchritudo TaxID=28173 RepID=UPI0003B18804|nr:aldehyde dehydrogenase [Vibrio nigripulchritudo]CCN48775.1 Lactaldehyde dehydrogenase [Vibrio nigripulchritudo MADA3020]CCN54034.1 Lactaldehyde dehydrogenase [Vibrio nigripulchritudo MADA3021]CCN60896.1 Lactaldehyde dehydrogenase [Vibrio nigripulchritudo MADA3029]
MKSVSDTLNAIATPKMYVNGEWTTQHTTQWMDVENPANELIIASIPSGDTDTAAYAIQSAKTAQSAWNHLPPVKRAELIDNLAKLVMENQHHLAMVITLEQGKPLNQAMGEVAASANFLSYAASSARRTEGHIFPSDMENEEVWIRRAPFGVVVALTAWNYPLALAARKLGPALVAGNTVVLKPHEVTPLATVELFKLIDQAGFPAGVANLVLGGGRDLGEALVTNKNTQLVTMTGSVRAGREIYRAGADDIKVLRLELGGKAPFIVMDDADIDAAVESAMTARFTNCGQICTCNERMYVHAAVYDQVVEKMLAATRRLTLDNPVNNPDMGPKVSKPELEKVADQLGRAKQEGAEVLIGGNRPETTQFEKGHWIEPAVVAGLKNDSVLVKEEIFGPVLPIIKVDSYEEAIEKANASDYGLSAYLYTQNFKRIMNAHNEFQFGELYINRTCGELVQGFHTGWGLSGLGGEDGVFGLDNYYRKQTSYVNWQ